MVYFPFSSSTPGCDDNDTTSSGDLFGNYDNDLIVTNSIGEIAKDTTVGQLKQQNSDLTDIIAKMLAIKPLPVVPPKINPQGSLVITTPSGDVKFNQKFPSEITLRFYRGKWEDAFQSDGSQADTLPYNPATECFIGGAFGFSQTSAPITTSNVTAYTPENVNYKKAVPSQTGKFTNWDTIALIAYIENETPSISTGDVYDNYGTKYPAPVNYDFLADKIWKVYKPVFLDGGEVTESEQGSQIKRGTVKVFKDTKEVIFVNHNFGIDMIFQLMEVPFLPKTVYQYDAGLINKWYTVPFTYTSITNYNNYGQYYEITLGIVRRLELVDVKISAN